MKVLKKIFLSLFLLFFLTLILMSEDSEWVKCSNEKDLYRYVYEGWKVDKVLKNGDITFTKSGQPLYYKGIEPQIYLSKKDNIKVLNFGWRCYHLESSELNYKKEMF